MRIYGNFSPWQISQLFESKVHSFNARNDTIPIDQRCHRIILKSCWKNSDLWFLVDSYTQPGGRMQRNQYSNQGTKFHGANWGKKL